jgi:hypothetical protein
LNLSRRRSSPAHFRILGAARNFLSGGWLDGFPVFKQDVAILCVHDSDYVRRKEEIDRMALRWSGGNICGDVIERISRVTSPGDVEHHEAPISTELDYRPPAAPFLKYT